MKIKHYFVLLLLGFSVLTSCKKDEEEKPAPAVKMGITGKELNGKVNEKIAFSASIENGVSVEHTWTLDGVIKTTESSFAFTPLKSGIYNVTYTAKAEGGTFTYAYVLNVGIPTVPTTPGSSSFVTRLLEYNPAPGQFINTSLGNLVGAQGILGKMGMVSLGAWGGYIVLGFDHTVINEVNKDDIIVYGNPMQNFAEPGIIWVMQDENGNGLADDTWYEIAGSEFNKPGYKKDYSVTYTKPNPVTGDVPWKDSDGSTGVVKTNIYHTQSYFPEWKGTEYTLKGSKLPSTGINRTVPTFITSAPFAWGYADNTVGGDKIDIAKAVDKDGKTVALAGIDFIKIQTGIQADMGWLGELSTEVTGVEDLSLVKAN